MASILEQKRNRAKREREATKALPKVINAKPSGFTGDREVDGGTRRGIASQVIGGVATVTVYVNEATLAIIGGEVLEFSLNVDPAAGDIDPTLRGGDAELRNGDRTVYYQFDNRKSGVLVCLEMPSRAEVDTLRVTLPGGKAKA